MRNCFLSLLLCLLLFGCTPKTPVQLVKPEPIPLPPVIQPEECPPELPQEPPQTAPEPISVCTISISCRELLEEVERCDPEKTELIPHDGWILPPTQVELQSQESVFDLLLRVCKEHGILMEYTDAPMYDSAYIEGIGGIYEFDAGPLSGWRYSVNGTYPNYGCSQYHLTATDAVCWEYTCE